MLTSHEQTARGSKGLAIAGFTLIELMVVIAIVGILAAIALPSYQSSIQRGDRAAARATILEAQQFMERYYATNNTYVGAVLPARFLSVPVESPKYNIAVAIVAGPPQTFRLTAAPINPVIKCGSLTVTNTGVKGVTVPGSPTAADIAECWR